MREHLTKWRRLLSPGRELVLTGLRLHDWRELLTECEGNIPVSYWARAARLTVQSVLNEVMARTEEGQLSKLIETQQPADPIFVLGCWRSGTTWLHHLLATDPHLATPTSLQVLCPHTFFYLEGRLTGSKARLGRHLYGLWARANWGRYNPNPVKRASDNVLMGLNQPAEDEFALLMMKRSDLMAHLVGTQLAPRYRRFLTLRQLEPAELEAWKKSWMWFLKKLTLYHGKRPLVLKSPNHTARVKTILSLFPKARFLHIHRHPYDVYRSLLEHLRIVESVSEVLQKRDPRYHETCLELYETLYSAYLDDRHLIPQGQLLEIPFHQLEADPQASLVAIYQNLGLPGPPPGVPKKDYRKNAHPPLAAETRAVLDSRWARYFEAFGYQP